MLMMQRYILFSKLPNFDDCFLVFFLYCRKPKTNDHDRAIGKEKTWRIQ